MPKKTKSTKKTDANKPWNRRPEGLAIPVNQRSLQKSFLIVCEGQNTEPQYFKSFPVGNAEVESYGLGSSKTALVKQVIDILSKDADARSKEVWVVFDFDSKPDQIVQQKDDYNHAVALAAKHNIHVACSNDAFELWFLLHYQYLDTQWTRHQYYQRLSELWQCNYDKLGKRLEFCRNLYRRMQDDGNASQQEAAKRAKQLHELFGNAPFAEKNPHTTVFQLVEELNQYIL